MTDAVGLWIGDRESTAAIVRDGGEPRYVTRETVLHMSEAGTSLGGPLPTGGETVDGFVERVGDPDGIALADGAYRAEDLYATAVFCLIDLASARVAPPESGVRTHYVLAHPAHWSAAEVAAVRDSLNYLGLDEVRLQPVADPTKSGNEIAQDAALAHSAADGPDEPATDEIPVITVHEIVPAFVGPIVDVQAYSAVSPGLAGPGSTTAPVTQLPATSAMSPPAIDATRARPIRIAAVTTKSHGRGPLLVAAGFATVLALAGTTVGVAIRDAHAPLVPDVTAAVPTTTTNAPLSAPPAEPAVLPSADQHAPAFIAETTEKVASAPVPSSAAPSTVEVTTAAPPQPSSESAPPPPPVTETTDTTSASTDPSDTTTTTQPSTGGGADQPPGDATGRSSTSSDTDTGLVPKLNAGESNQLSASTPEQNYDDYFGNATPQGAP